MKSKITFALAGIALFAHTPAFADDHDSHHATPEKHEMHAAKSVAEQRKALAHNTEGKGFGPQAPRDIDAKNGTNDIIFGTAPASTEMNLCNIHFH